MKSRYGEARESEKRCWVMVKVTMAKTTSRVVGGHDMDVRHVPGVVGWEGGEWGEREGVGSVGIWATMPGGVKALEGERVRAKGDGGE